MGQLEGFEGGSEGQQFSLVSCETGTLVRVVPSPVSLRSLLSRQTSRCGLIMSRVVARHS
ncbi:unnamed protein product, partial [Closterium sp. Yama58-4]